MNRRDLNKLHRDLRRFKFFYYELDDSLITDYEFDQLEKIYTEACDRLGVVEGRLDNFVGFDMRMPMNLFYDEDNNPLGAITVVNKYTHNPTDNDVYIGRGSVLGNPYTSIKDRDTKAQVVCDSREESIAKYKVHLEDAVKNKLKPITNELNRIYKLAKSGNVNLVCYCSPKTCHGDIIKEIIESKL